MPARRTGSPSFKRGRWQAQIFVCKGHRPTVELPYTDRVEDESKARRRAALLAELGAAMADGADHATTLLKHAACAPNDKAIRDLIDAANKGDLIPKGNGGSTFKDVATEWTSGRLARKYPDHVRPRKRVRDDVSRFEHHIYPLVGDVPVADFTRQHAGTVMAALPPKLSPKTRREVGQLINRVLSLAVEPMQILEQNPLPRGWVPKARGDKAKSYLYPDEEAKLLSCTAVPLGLRVVYAFLSREGMRKSGALGLTWADIDLKKGVVTLDDNKTDDPRAWALGSDVAEALRRWHKLSGKPKGPAPVFKLPVGDLRSDDLRDNLKRAGVRRPQLFESNDKRMPIRVHDLRGTFVTLALAAGRSEAWVTDRTGHRSSQMVFRYKRVSRTASELGLGWLKPMHIAIPELAKCSRRSAAGNGARRLKCSGSAAPSRGPRGGNGIPRRILGGSTGTRTLDLRVKSETGEIDGAQGVDIVDPQNTFGPDSDGSDAHQTPSAALRDEPVGEASNPQGAPLTAGVAGVEELSDGELKAAARALIGCDMYRAAMALLSELERRSAAR